VNIQLKYFGVPSIDLTNTFIVVSLFFGHVMLIVKTFKEMHHTNCIKPQMNLLLGNILHPYILAFRFRCVDSFIWPIGNLHLVQGQYTYICLYLHIEEYKYCTAYLFCQYISWNIWKTQWYLICSHIHCKCTNNTNTLPVLQHETYK
jgi:hypothetical protein